MPRTSEPIRELLRFGCGCWQQRDETTRCPTHKQRVDRKLSRWEARADVGPAGAGRREQQRRRFATRAAARVWLADTRAAVNAGTYVRGSRLTVDAHLTAWLAGKRDLKPSTRRNYADMLRPVRAALGRVPVQAVTKADLDAVVQARLDAGLSARTVVLTLVVMQQALDDAMRQGLTVRNVAALVERPRVQHREMAAWSLPQAGAFLAVAGEDRLAAAWTLTLRGLRRGEVVGLRWSDVDLDAGTLAVRQARVLVGGRSVIGSPKSARGRRVLPLDAELVTALRAFHAQQARERLVAGAAYDGTSGLVVVDELGRPVPPEWYSDRFARLAKTAAVPAIRLHDARHTAATLMLDAGIPVHVVAAWLGHDPAITHRVYAHADLAGLRAAGDALSRALAGG